MRSTLTFSNASCAARTARRASSAVCSRPRNFSSSSWIDWTPIESRLMPASRRPANRSVFSGFASSAISPSTGPHDATIRAI
jgi:hypothetical protein